MKILWLKTEILHPIDKGGKIRTYETLKCLKRDHHITYLSFRQQEDSRESLDKAAEYANSLITVPLESAKRYSAAFYAELSANLASALPYAIQKYRSDAMKRAIHRAVSQGEYDLVVSDFLTPSVNLMERIGPPSILFQHNVESQIWERHYQKASSPIKKAYFYGQFRKMERFEGRSLRRFNGIIAVSESDRQTMASRFGVSPIHCVPTGVDTGYFRPVINRPPNPRELVFTGSMDYLPNEDAIIYFAQAMLPRISMVLENVTLTVVGRNPGSKLRALSRSDPRITVTGAVPDVRPYLSRAACVVVPLRVGGGTRLKIFEAMSMAKPVVSTTVGAEGLPVSDGIDILLADDPEEFAQRVTQVLTSVETGNRIADQARELVIREFTWEASGTEFARICDEIITSRRVSRAA